MPGIQFRLNGVETDVDADPDLQLRMPLAGHLPVEIEQSPLHGERGLGGAVHVVVAADGPRLATPCGEEPLPQPAAANATAASETARTTRAERERGLRTLRPVIFGQESRGL